MHLSVQFDSFSEQRVYIITLSCCLAGGTSCGAINGGMSFFDPWFTSLVLGRIESGPPTQLEARLPPTIGSIGNLCTTSNTAFLVVVLD